MATISKHEEASTRQHPSGELDQLRARVIGLENLIIALLADATEVQLDRVRDMSLHISPRQGSVPHPLTTDAAAHMMSMVARARHFRK